MKKLSICIFLSLIGFTSYSQIPKNLLETADECSIQLLNQINKYRKEKGLSELRLDTNLTRACLHHCEYLSVYDEGGHFETTRDSSHLIKSIVAPLDRSERFNVRRGNTLSENCVNIGAAIFKDSTFSPLVKIWKENAKKGIIDSKFSAKMVLQKWIESPDHNLNLLYREGTVAGVYQKVFINRAGKIKIVSTFLVSNPSID